MAQNRVPAIDILKFIAVFLVMNSHMEICYPKFQFLATGGGLVMHFSFSHQDLRYSLVVICDLTSGIKGELTEYIQAYWLQQL